MRISDWISDVCSSDLKMTGNGSDPEPASEDSRLVSLDERLDRAEAAEAKRSGVKAPESDANYRLGNPVQAELLGGLLGRGLIGWLIDRFAGTAPRSDEHTSELQSLMRISYSIY